MKKKTTKTKSHIKPTAALIIGPQPEAILAARSAVMEIVNAHCGDSTKSEALKALHTICSVNNTSVSECNFTMGGK